MDASASLSDYEKLTQAFSSLTGHFSSTEDVLSAFGLHNMPAAQKYGILFGFIVFTLTIGAVVTLLVFGGSFSRIAEQQETGDATVPDAVAARTNRPLLYETLLESRDKMTKNNYHATLTEDQTPLMKMVLNLEIGVVGELVDEQSKKKGRFIPPGYQDSYAEAYRKCQDKPGGAIISGRPEARYEAYARSWAGSSDQVHRNYKRSHARLYEFLATQNHSTDDKFRLLYNSRPQDLVGRLVRLEALEADRHVKELHAMTCGKVHHDAIAYDPLEVWSFMNYGPFQSAQEMAESRIFRRRQNEAGFAIVDNITDRLIGIVMLLDDDPENLTISLETPIIQPSLTASMQATEGCYLVLDKLFALGYRRIQFATDVQDAPSKRLASRLGFTKEADCIPKHRVVKDANRDSTIYGMLNSDWTKGCRAFLFKKLHGSKMSKYDEINNKKETEMDEQNEKLALKKAEEELAKKK